MVYEMKATSARTDDDTQPIVINAAMDTENERTNCACRTMHNTRVKPCGATIGWQRGSVVAAELTVSSRLRVRPMREAKARSHENILITEMPCTA